MQARFKEFIQSIGVTKHINKKCHNKLLSTHNSARIEGNISDISCRNDEDTIKDEGCPYVATKEERYVRKFKRIHIKHA